MSQYRCRTTCGEKPVELLLGWDRPLSEFFFTAFAVDAVDNEVVVASSPMPGYRSVDELKEGLAEAAIAVPAQMLAEVAADEMLNRGNRTGRFEAAA